MGYETRIISEIRAHPKYCRNYIISIYKWDSGRVHRAQKIGQGEHAISKHFYTYARTIFNVSQTKNAPKHYYTTRCRQFAKKTFERAKSTKSRFLTPVTLAKFLAELK